MVAKKRGGDMKHINQMTKREFFAVPTREKWNQEVLCDGLVLLPTRSMHDSGYRCIDAVAVLDGKPLCRVAGSSDVIHIEGIAAFLRKSIAPWTIDCLPKSGLFRLWVEGEIRVGPSLSSLEIFSTKRR